MSFKLETLFNQLQPSLVRLQKNLEEALKLILDSKHINYLGVYGRVKSFDSFKEKINDKGYSNPFSQTEDLVGLRIIVYFKYDIPLVTSILNKEFNVHNQQNKADLLDDDTFGYRSYHCVISIPDEWGLTPNYKGLNSLKAEIQIRTVLMHAWAEVEHSLQYKNKNQIPKELRREIFLLSAKCEDADNDFQLIKEKQLQYKDHLAKLITKEGKFNESVELNLDSFRKFLEFSYPNLEKPQDLLEAHICEMILAENLSFADLTEIVEKFRDLESVLLHKLPLCNRANTFYYAGQVFNSAVFPNNIPMRKKIVDELKAQVKGKDF